MENYNIDNEDSQGNNPRSLHCLLLYMIQSKHNLLFGYSW